VADEVESHSGAASGDGSQESQRNVIECEVCNLKYDGNRYTKCPKCEEKRVAAVWGGSEGTARAASKGQAPRPTATVPATVEYQQAEIARLDQGVALQKKILSAQISVAMYLRAGLMLAFTLLVTLGAIQQGNAAEQAKTLKCLGDTYCSVTGGGVWFLIALVALAVGTLFTVIFTFAAGVRLRSAQE
jgi:hypothetical protein